MLIGSELSCSNSAIARKAGWKRLTFQSSCAEKKSIITLCSGFCVEMLWGDKRSPLGEGGQTETDLLYLLKQRHKWKVDLRSLEIIKTSSWCQPPFSTDKTVNSTLWTFTPLYVFYIKMHACFSSSQTVQTAEFNGKLFLSVFANLIGHTVSA